MKWTGHGWAYFHARETERDEHLNQAMLGCLLLLDGLLAIVLIALAQRAP